MYTDFFSPSEEVLLSSIFADIKSDKFQSEISSIRYAYQQGKEDLSQSLKKQLPAFTPSGTFKDRRKIENLLEHSGIIHLDIDGLDISEVATIKDKVNQSPFTWASFISPRGNGLKVFIKCQVDSTSHSEVWQKLDDHYTEIIGFRTDNKCKDVSRLCFISNDPDLFLNEKSEIFKRNKLENETPVRMNEDNLDTCKNFTEQKETYALGSRNSFIHLFACNANRMGIDKDEAQQYCLLNYELPESEIKATFKSVYNNNSHEFAKFANIASPKTQENENESNSEDDINKMAELLQTTPYIKDEVFATLPNLLKETCEVFDDKRERDVYLVSALGILSGCLKNVSGIYFDTTVYPNLFSFILAPPASGKNSMIFAKKLGDKLHQTLVEESKVNQEEYKIELREYKKRHQGKGANADQDEEEPKEPPFRVLYVPANSSSAKVYEHIQHNSGKGIICETEADTLGTVFKSEWGTYSDLLRKAFHHERISVSRKTDNLYYEIEEPQLSVVLTGTPNQILNIIPSAEDGLYSRFLFYTFGAPPIWKSPAPKPGRPNRTDYFKQKGEEVYEMANMLELYSTCVYLTEDQWQIFDTYFESILNESNELVSAESTSIVKRLGLIFYRICLTFTAIRKYENGDTSKDIYCDETDFLNAKSIIETLYEHSVTLYTNLPGGDNEFKITKATKKQQFFEALPIEFKRKDAIEIGKTFKIPTRTVDYILTKVWLDLHIEKIDTGLYKKIAP
jgi:hypothetical protein